MSHLEALNSQGRATVLEWQTGKQKNGLFPNLRPCISLIVKCCVALVLMKVRGCDSTG